MKKLLLSILLLLLLCSCGLNDPVVRNLNYEAVKENVINLPPGEKLVTAGYDDAGEYVLTEPITDSTYVPKVYTLYYISLTEKCKFKIYESN